MITIEIFSKFFQFLNKEANKSIFKTAPINTKNIKQNISEVSVYLKGDLPVNSGQEQKRL